MELDDEDYELLGISNQWQASEGEFFIRSLSWARLEKWKLENAERARRQRHKKEYRRLKRRRAEGSGVVRKQARTYTLEQLAARAAYIRDYRSTEEGKRRTDAATEKYRASEKGKQTRSLENKAQYAKRKAKR